MKATAAAERGGCPGGGEQAARRPRRRSPRAVMLSVVALYFAAGLPYGILTEALRFYLGSRGVALAVIGSFGTLQMAWTVKFLWSPLVARLGHWRRWMAGSLVAMAAVLVLLACGLRWAWFDSAAGIAVAIVLLSIFALASATQDIAIDGAFVRLLQPEQAGLASGWRVAAYRIAMLVGGGGAVWASTVVSWRGVLVGLAALIGALNAVPLLLSEDRPAAAAPAQRAAWLDGIRPWLRAPGSVSTLAFLLLYKFGDNTMSTMVMPFLLAHGRGAREIATGFLGLGLGASVLGALWGGGYASRRGTPRALLVLGLWQAGSNLGYAAVALGGWGSGPLYAASLLESVSQGLGTAAQLALVTQLCDRAHATVQFALLTAVYGLGRALSAPVGGLLAHLLGYRSFFVLTFFLSLPALLLLPAVGRRLRHARGGPASPGAPA